MHSVIKAWVFNLPYRMQSVLMSALRGCDTARKDDPSKFITRALRPLVLNNADPSNTFMVGDGIPEDKHSKQFLWDIDCYPMHFVMHTAHAAEIIGYKYNGELDQRIATGPQMGRAVSTRIWWGDFYRNVMKGLHVNPETEEQLDVRLGFTPGEKAMQDVPSADLLAAFQAALIAGKPGFAQHLAKHGYGMADPADDHEWDAGTGTSHGGRTRKYSGSS